MKGKDKAWLEVTSEFNANSLSCLRELKQLKLFYENWKKKRKKDNAAIRMSQRQTGGGPPQDIKLGEVDLLLMELLKDRINPLDNPYDSEGVMCKYNQFFSFAPQFSTCA